MEEAIIVNRRLTHVRVVSHVTESIEQADLGMSAERLGIHPPNRRFGDVKTCAKIVSKHERADQKENRLQVCQEWRMCRLHVGGESLQVGECGPPLKFYYKS